MLTGVCRLPDLTLTDIFSHSYRRAITWDASRRSTLTHSNYHCVCEIGSYRGKCGAGIIGETFDVVRG